MKKALRRVLAIESSCDETAAAVLEAPLDVRSSIIASQIAAHRPYGGVVPELATRAHVDAIDYVVEEALREAACDLDALDGIAVTRGPGLASSLMVGVQFARTLAWRADIPLFGVHHLEGHLCSVFLAETLDSMHDLCPSLVLLVTGGHTALVRMDAPGVYTVLGRSLDDAAGEALDKGAKLMGLPYPGGPEIEKLAREGTRSGVFPRSLPHSDSARERGGQYAFSFSGLKTALRYFLEKNPDASHADVAADFQSAVMDSLLTRLRQAAEKEKGIRSLACVGGGAKNQHLRGGLDALAVQVGKPLHIVPMAYCTDNAAMIGTVPLLRTMDPMSVDEDLHPNLRLEGVRLRG